MQTGSPVVLLDNTGSETQQYARLITEIQRLQRTGLKTAAQLRGKAQHCLEFAKQGTKQNVDLAQGYLGMFQLNLAEVLRLMDMMIEKPTYFQETLMVVDVLQDTTDTVVHKISKSFSSKTTHAFEMGSGDADAHILTEAWRLHQVLTTNSSKLWRRDVFLMSMVAMFTLLGIMSAVLIAVVDTREEDAVPPWLMRLGLKDFADIADDLGLVSIVAPACATLFGGAALALRCKMQATAMLGAAVGIVGEIFSFRMRVGDYNIAMSQVSSGNDDAEAETNESMRMKLARAAFQKRIQQLGSVLGVGAALEAEMHYEENLGDLRTYVETECYGQRLEEATVHSSEKAKPLLFGAEASFEIEHLHSMSSAAYYHTRVQPLLKLYQSRAPRLARLQSLFTMITLLLSTGATILAAFDYQIWVPLVYGLSAFLKTFQTYHAWGPRQIAMARAVADLTTLATFWSSLTFVDRGLPSTRNYMVSVTEQAVASICQAETGAQVGQGAGKAPASGKDNSKKSEKKDAENK
eukprot:TRINITY_DN22942_c0_g1_i1.p1 TRINITY_DN22942_c0_g1~~TRINITY_DN22942_c0_g1_i1.p1  ORF type:complete len:521 (+),score=81.92 TRINITY_DN22942_c0_g1_i1:194-1756(+)